MKRFITDIVIVIGFLCVGSIGIDYGMSKALQKSQARMFVGWNDILHKHIDADLVILGSSRAWVHYDPHILDSILRINSYNLGIDGGRFLKQQLKYNIYKQYQALPKLIVLNIDYLFGLSEEGEYEREQLFPYFLYPSWRKEIEKIRPKYTTAELYIPNYRYINAGGDSYFMRFIPGKNDLYKGYTGKDEIWDGSLLKKQKTLHAKYDEVILQSLEQFVIDNQNDSVKVVFCFAPWYIGCTEKVDNFQEIMDKCQHIADAHNVPILDYTFSYISMDTTFFYNASHMNKYGAELFSTQLAHDLDSLGIISKFKK